MVDAARVAAARVTLRAARQAGIERALVLTNAPGLFEGSGAEVVPDSAGGPFRFDAALRALVAGRGIETPIVMGSGALPLFGTNDFAELLRRLEARERVCVTNNFFSSDLTAWRPASSIAEVGAFERDNQLPRRLRDDAGLSSETLPRATATQFDLDTPSDLCVWALRDESVRAAMRAWAYQLPLEAYRRTMRVLCDPKAELVVAGRVGSQLWQYLERETACRVRMFSEERGLAAAGSEHRARSLIGFLFERAGPEAFFEMMAELGDALVLDTRVIEAHLAIAPTREERFASDLYRWDDIAEPSLRALTKAAAEAPIPVLLGGHSLVSGGLMLLNDVAWEEEDRRKEAAAGA